jgi:hypothetical protein
MKIIIFVIAVFVVGDYPTCPSPAPAPAPRPLPAPRPAPAPKPVLPAAAVPIIVAAASNPVVRQGIINGVRIVGTQASKLAPVARNIAQAGRTAFTYSKEQIGNIIRWIKGTNTVTYATTGVATSPLKPVLKVLGKTAEGVSSAANIGLSVASVIQISQLTGGVSTCSKVLFQPLCSLDFGGPGGFTLSSQNLKIIWNDKSSTCRDNIRNVADVRPQFEQKLPQFSSTVSLNFQIESHRNAATN